MARIEINGDLKCFSSEQLEKIYIVLDELNFKGKETSIEPFGSAGDNFSSDVKVIIVNVSDEETFKIIIKSSISATLPKEINIMTSFIFNNEITMYTEVLPMMVQIQKMAGVKKENLFKYAKCFGVDRRPANQMIFLEDLTQDNFTMLDKFKPLSNDTVKIVLHNLAIFHSLSYALKTNDPVQYSESCKKLLDINAIEGFQLILKQIMFLGEKLGQIFTEEKYRKIMKQSITEYANNDIKLTASDYDSKYSVIIHGDSWANNILFQLKDDTPSKCVLIDYQLSKVSLPVSDIFYLIFNCTDYETRKQYYYEWLDFYHSELDKSLFNFSLKIANVYPRDRFDSDLMRYAKTSLGRSLITSVILQRNNEESAAVKDAVKSENASDMEDLFQISSIQKDTVSIIKKKIEGLIDSCYDFGYLNCL